MSVSSIWLDFTTADFYSPYRRTVIVTAAVYWSFSSEPNHPKIKRPLSLTYQHWAGVSPYTVLFSFAGTCVFDKQSASKLLVPPSYDGNPSPEVTGSFFAEFLKHPSLDRLRVLPQPTCVGFGTA